jgi:hypothetical protein
MRPSDISEDCYRVILFWYWEFQRAEAIERVDAFRGQHGSAWSTTMSLLRELTPMYRVVWTNEVYPSPMTVFLPDCSPPFSLRGATIERRVPFFRPYCPPLNLND